jgi:hypothetical protein
MRYKVGVSAETFRAIPNRLRREPADEIEPSLHPAGERVISRIAVWLDADKARQGPADEPHRSHVRLAECLAAAFRAHPDHERRTGDATEHTAVDKERQAAYHPFFNYIAPMRWQLPHPLGSCKIVAQLPSAPFRQPPRSLRPRCALRAAGKPRPGGVRSCRQIAHEFVDLRCVRKGHSGMAAGPAGSRQAQPTSLGSS